MGAKALLLGLGLVVATYGCTSSSSRRIGNDGGGSADGGSDSRGSIGTGGAAATGGIASTGGITANGGTTGQCGEPVPCDGFDNRADANVSASVSCLWPATAPTNTPLALSIFGQHLATGPGNNAIVILGSAPPLNGIPVTACHLEVQVPANQLSTPGQISVVVSPGGWTLQSPPIPLTLR